MSEETPIFAAARRASDFMHGSGEQLQRPSRPRIIAIANQKGGVGKTTSTVNLAAALAAGGLGVMVIDLDPQGNASTALGVEHSEGTPSSYNLLLWEQNFHELAQQSSFLPNLTCIPATVDLAGAEIELVQMYSRERRLEEVLVPEDLTALGIDYVFIDCPPSLGLLTLNAMVAAKELLVPIQCEYYALEGVTQLLRNVDLVKQHLNKNLDVATVLLTMYDGRTNLSKQVADEVREYFGDKVLENHIPRNIKVSEAPSFNQTIFGYDPGSRGALAYLDAAREINERFIDKYGAMATDNNTIEDVK